MRRASTILWVFLVVGLGTDLGLLQAGAQTLEDINPSVVKIVARVNGKTKIGTGLVIKVEQHAAYIVTASHVVEGDPSPTIEFSTQRNRSVSARIIGLEGGDDRGLAGLLVEGALPRGIHPMPLNSQVDVRPGDAVTLIGFPRMAGVPWAVTTGETVGRKGRDLVFSGPVDEGNSGGPLLKEHQVIGIVSEVGSPFAYAVPSLIAHYALESWGVRFGIHLRNQPATVLPQYVVHMIQANRFHHPSDLREKGFSGFVLGSFEHEFETRKHNGNSVVLDKATGLMWQQYGSDKEMFLSDAEGFVESLNAHRLAGFSDWRLPTIEELASLVEPVGAHEGLFIDSRFSALQTACWTSDSTRDLVTVTDTWIVNFLQGSVYSDTSRTKYFARAVRSLGSTYTTP
jgi:Protein of unknown function (DUF1566)/Trypsin-like peptidase domain